MKSGLGLAFFGFCWVLTGCGASGGASATDIQAANEDAGTVEDSVQPSDSSVSSDGSVADAAVPANGCMATHFLDLTEAPGAGGAYEAAWVNASCVGTTLRVTSNSMPHYTFVSVTPNALVPMTLEVDLPMNPQVNAELTDLPLLGVIGVAVNGVVLYGPNEGEHPDPFGDPQLNAITDGCWGHTAQAYHFHGLREICLTQGQLVAEPWTLDEPAGTGPSPVLGFALDGFPIYGPNGCLDDACTEIVRMKSSWEAIGYEKLGCATDADCGTGFQCGKVMVDGEQVMVCGSETYAWDHNECTKPTCAKGEGAWLDQCNGRFMPDGSYRYHATDTFPHILGCYRGTAVTVDGGAGPGNGAPPGPGPQACGDNGDCEGACGPAAQGCGCMELTVGPMAGQAKCVPLCATDADCPATPNGATMTCVADGFCEPSIGGPGMP